nr:Uma2 family endonuclease [Granulicella aggregans]
MAAASTTQVPGLLSIEQYLNTTYRPDVDYVDGAIEERNLGDTDHSKLQGELYFLLRSRQRAWSVLILPKVRVQVSPTRFRIPDVCVVRMAALTIRSSPRLRCFASKSSRLATVSPPCAAGRRTTSTWLCLQSGSSIRRPALPLSALPTQ